MNEGAATMEPQLNLRCHTGRVTVTKTLYYPKKSLDFFAPGADIENEAVELLF
jgi:hypothetical protein